MILTKSADQKNIQYVHNCHSPGEIKGEERIYVQQEKCLQSWKLEDRRGGDYVSKYYNKSTHYVII